MGGFVSYLIGILFSDLTAGFLLGMVSSWLFWRWQLTVKPAFTVSRSIAVRAAKEDAGKLVFRIKIINESARPIIDMKASLGVHEISRSGRGPTRRTIHRIGLRPSDETIIGPYARCYDPWAITSVHYYTSDPDAEAKVLLNERETERRLVLTLQATDAESGTTVLRRLTYTADDLVDGHFEPERGLKVLSASCADAGEDQLVPSKPEMPATSVSSNEKVPLPAPPLAASQRNGT